jgi:Fe2+ transport system protein FeoA
VQPDADKNRPEPSIISLDRAPHSEWVEVLDLPRGRRASRSLAQVGINVNEKLRVVSAAPWGGPVLVDAAGSTVAIGRSLASRIKVRVVDSNGKGA